MQLNSGTITENVEQFSRGVTDTVRRPEKQYNGRQETGREQGEDQRGFWRDGINQKVGSKWVQMNGSFCGGHPIAVA